MKKVCINDERLPEGASLKIGNTYTVIEEFINDHEQKTYLLEGVTNSGITKLGLRWHGYRADRFADPGESVQLEINFEELYAN
jgi:hypothetical protein